MHVKKTLKIALVVASCLSATVTNSVAAQAFRPNNLVTIWGDRGGEVIRYALQVKRYEKRGSSLKFAGRCDSACTIYLSMPSSRMCLTKGASFGFHLPYGASARGNKTAANYMLKKYPGWVRSWLNANGGLTSSIKRMDYRYASRFVRTCETRTKSWF